MLRRKLAGLAKQSVQGIELRVKQHNLIKDSPYCPDLAWMQYGAFKVQVPIYVTVKLTDLIERTYVF